MGSKMTDAILLAVWDQQTHYMGATIDTMTALQYSLLGWVITEF